MKKIISGLIFIILLINSQHVFSLEKILIIVNSIEGKDKLLANTFFNNYLTSDNYIIYDKQEIKNQLHKKYIFLDNLTMELVKKIGNMHHVDFLIVCHINNITSNVVYSIKMYETKKGKIVNDKKKFDTMNNKSQPKISNFTKNIRLIDKQVNTVTLFKKGCDISIGGNLAPFMYNFNLGNIFIKSDNGYNIVGGFNDYRFGIGLPFSINYFYHPAASIGFAINIKYLFGLIEYQQIDSQKIINYTHNISLNVGIKHKFGDPSWNFRFILEYGALVDLQILQYKSPITIERNNSLPKITDTYFFNGIFLGGGPFALIGTESRYKNFSVELGVFCGFSFGNIYGTDIVNTNSLNIRIPITGVEIQFNYYYYNYYYKKINFKTGKVKEN